MAFADEFDGLCGLMLWFSTGTLSNVVCSIAERIFRSNWLSAFSLLQNIEKSNEFAKACMIDVVT